MNLLKVIFGIRDDVPVAEARGENLCDVTVRALREYGEGQ